MMKVKGFFVEVETAKDNTEFLEIKQPKDWQLKFKELKQ